MNHEHKFEYGDIPGVGKCSKCGAYKVWNRFTEQYEIHEKEEAN